MHRLIVHRRSYHEVAAALDAVASLPDAADPDAAELIALERLEALARYPVEKVGDDEVERVLDATATERAAMPPGEGARQMRRACWHRPALVLRHLVPHLAELEQSAPEDAETLESLGRQIAIARGEPQPPVEPDEDAEDLESSPKIPDEVVEAIRYGHALRRMGWPHEEVFAVLDEAATLPAAAEYAGTLAYDRIMVGHMYEVPEDEMERTIQHALRAYMDVPAWRLASTISVACGRHPALAERYLPAFITNAEAELHEHPDDEAQQYLDGVKRSLERTRTGG